MCAKGLRLESGEMSRKGLYQFCEGEGEKINECLKGAKKGEGKVYKVLRWSTKKGEGPYASVYLQERYTETRRGKKGKENQTLLLKS